MIYSGNNDFSTLQTPWWRATLRIAGTLTSPRSSQAASQCEERSSRKRRGPSRASDGAWSPSVSSLPFFLVRKVRLCDRCSAGVAVTSRIVYHKPTVQELGSETARDTLLRDTQEDEACRLQKWRFITGPGVRPAAQAERCRAGGSPSKARLTGFSADLGGWRAGCSPGRRLFSEEQTWGLTAGLISMVMKSRRRK